MLKHTYLIIIALIIQSVIHFISANEDAANFAFASYYSDNMVLQRAPYKASIWGYAANRSVVTLTFIGKLYSSAAVNVDWTNKAIWKITLDPTPATTSSSLNLTFTQTTTNGQFSTIKLNNILFGDVWVCSGQSNMGWSIGNSFNGSLEAQNAAKYDKLRIFQTAQVQSRSPLNDLLGIAQRWSVPSAQTVPGFSAVCWNFGKNIYDKINVPLGLLVTSWGGTNIEMWSSPEVLSQCNVPAAATDSVLWNAMVHPFLSMTIYGTLWYQGEANTYYNTKLYNCTFPAMIDDWRSRWYQKSGALTNSNFPFGFVQLANQNVENQTVGTYPTIRYLQTASYGYAPNPRQINVFMATAVDLVDNYEDTTPNVVHPRYKSDVGYRLALGALNLAYGFKSVEYLPPLLNSITYSSASSIATIKFSSEFQPIKFDLRSQYGFDVCCQSNQQCLIDDNKPWQAVVGIRVAEDSTVSFNLPSNCKQLDYVRYLWRQKPCEFKQCALYSTSSELPVYPFLAAASAQN